MSLVIFSADDLSAMEKNYRTRFINSLPGFKPANLIGTQNKLGKTNLAIFTQVIHLGANPSLMGILVRPAASPRHTLENLMETGYFTINHVNSTIIEKAHQCSARYEKEISEFDAVGLTPYHSKNIIAPYVAEANIKIGLKMQQIIPISLNDTQLVVAEILEIIMEDDFVLEDGYIDIEKADSVAVSALDSYHSTKRKARLSYAKPGKDLSRF